MDNVYAAVNACREARAKKPFIHFIATVMSLVGLAWIGNRISKYQSRSNHSKPPGEYIWKTPKNVHYFTKILWFITDNFLLAYLLTLGIAMTPGLLKRGILQKHFAQLSIKVGELLQGKNALKKEM